MPRRKIQNRNVRKISKKGGSYMVTVPMEMMRQLKWQNKQKVVFKRRGKKLMIEDWTN